MTLCPSRRRALALAAAVPLTGLAARPTATLAADWPDRPIRVIVPFAAGGASDILARAIAPRLSETLRQPVLVDNRPGAGGTLGADLVAKAPPDGHTVLLSDVAAWTISPSLYPKLPYQAKDLAPVINLAVFAHILIAPPNGAVGSVAQLLAQERAQPGRLSVASSGNGTSTHLTAEMFNAATGARLVHVPYKGGGAALADVMGGQVPLMFIGTPPAMPLIASGKLRAIAVTTSRRMAALPNVPTVAESGVPGFESIAAQGVFAPAGTPREVIARLNAEIARILAQPDMQERLASLGAEPIRNDPAQFGEWLGAESVKWSRVVRDSGAKPD
jgi:tripartite-type tricarboxylate transporter receptor subunit TctC